MTHTASISLPRALLVGAIVAGFYSGCSELFGIEDSTRRSSGVAASGGEAGESGTPGGGSDKGGAGGVVSTRGGAGGKGGGGTGGSVSGDGGAGESGSGGAAGAGGEPGDDSPEPGRECGSPAARACSTAHPNLVLLCEDGFWGITEYCSATRDQARLCDPKNVSCSSVALDCRQHPQGFCKDTGSLIDCAEDRFNPVTLSCPYGCANGACLRGTGDQLIVHTETHDGPSRDWDGDIPVCFATNDPILRAITRSAVERSWGRYLHVNFTGWELCANEDVLGVVVEFLENCRGRLAGAVKLGDPELGNPGEKQSRVGICRTFWDGGGTRHSLVDSAPLADFLARHQFGHVLGLPEDAQAPGTSTSMVRALRWSNVDETVWANDIDELSSYGFKPHGTISTASGRCLSAENEVLSLAECSETSFAQQFRSTPNALENVGAAACLLSGTSGGTLLGFGACPIAPQSNAFALRRVRFHAPGHCVAARIVPVSGGPIVMQRCGEVGAEGQTWTFEIVGIVGGRPQARIRYAAQPGYCLAMTQPLPGGEIPTLEGCDTGPRTVFTLGPNGNVSLPLPNSTDVACLDFVGTDSVLSMRGSCQRQFLLSGPIEDERGHALAIVPGDPTAPLTVSSLASGATPRPEQVFDVHF